ncbi:MAG TPA: hypothetical protein VLR52_04225, partial [Bacteroidales bacterium]|nr:hypothetical protein [Bacteroidales bacterium]
EQFKHLNVIAIKITPHFHETTPGLKVIIEEPGYAIYEETNPESSKDTSRMLRAGAAKVYYAKVLDDRLLFVFNKIKELIPDGTPIVCESPALRYYAEPGAFLIISSETTNKRKNISELLKLPHVMFKFEELDKISSFPVGFTSGKWRIASS